MNFRFGGSQLVRKFFEDPIDPKDFYVYLYLFIYYLLLFCIINWFASIFSPILNNRICKLDMLFVCGTNLPHNQCAADAHMATNKSNHHFQIRQCKSHNNLLHHDLDDRFLFDRQFVLANESTWFSYISNKQANIIFIYIKKEKVLIIK